MWIFMSVHGYKTLVQSLPLFFSSYTFIHPYIYFETGSLTDKERPNLATLASKQASRPFCLPPWCWCYNSCTAQLLTGVLEI